MPGATGDRRPAQPGARSRVEAFDGPQPPGPSSMRSATDTFDAPAAAPVDAAPVIGIPLALIDYDGTLDWIDAMVAAGGRGYICVAAVHTVMAAQHDADLRAAVLGSDLTVPDGQPLVWALNAL